MNYGYHNASAIPQTQPVRSRTISQYFLAAISVILTLSVMLSAFGRDGGLWGWFPSSKSEAPKTETVPFAAETTQARSGVKQVAMNNYLCDYYRGVEEDYRPDEEYWAPFVVAALYDDGTVRVSCKEDYQEYYTSVAQWTEIEKIWVRGVNVIGLTKDGRVCTAGSADGYDTSELTDVADLAVEGNGLYAIRQDGSVAAVPLEGASLDDTVAQWTDVRKMLPLSENYTSWGYVMLRNDGTVAFSGVQAEYDSDNPICSLTDVRDILIVNYSPMAIREDGSVVYFGDEDPEADARLSGIVQAVEACDGRLFGITADGELKISTDMDWYDDGSYDDGWYTPAEAYRFTGVRDILDHDEMRTGDVLLLYEDGTVFSPTAILNDAVKDWTDVQKIAWYEEANVHRIYALRNDGTVIMAETPIGSYRYTVYENYGDWVLEDLYVARTSGCIGVCQDGSFVGDLAFETLDLTKLCKAA